MYVWLTNGRENKEATDTTVKVILAKISHNLDDRTIEKKAVSREYADVTNLRTGGSSQSLYCTCARNSGYGHRESDYRRRSYDVSSNDGVKIRPKQSCNLDGHPPKLDNGLVLPDIVPEYKGVCVWADHAALVKGKDTGMLYVKVHLSRKQRL